MRGRMYQQGYRDAVKLAESPLSPMEEAMLENRKDTRKTFATLGGLLGGAAGMGVGGRLSRGGSGLGGVLGAGLGAGLGAAGGYGLTRALQRDSLETVANKERRVQDLLMKGLVDQELAQSLSDSGYTPNFSMDYLSDQLPTKRYAPKIWEAYRNELAAQRPDLYYGE